MGWIFCGSVLQTINSLHLNAIGPNAKFSFQILLSVGGRLSKRVFTMPALLHNLGTMTDWLLGFSAIARLWSPTSIPDP